MDKRTDSELINQAIKALPALFASHGLQARVRAGSADASLQRADLLADVEGEGIQFELAIDVQRRFDEKALQDPPILHPRVRLLLVPRLGRSTRERLRARQCNHADLAGSFFLRAPGVNIDVDGRQPIDVVHVAADKQQINPFSKKASLVVRLLCDHSGAALSTAELVARTQLSRAWVFAVTQALIERGYATTDDRGCRLSHPVDLLRDWMAAYSWRQNSIRAYEVPFAHDEIPERLSLAFKPANIKWALTLLSAVQRRIGFVEFQGPLHIYALAPTSRSLHEALDTLYAQPVSSGGNLVLMSPPYYGDAVFVGSRVEKDCPQVSDVQLLLDLAHYPVRGPEAAELLIRRQLSMAFNLAPADVSRLVDAIA